MCELSKTIKIKLRKTSRKKVEYIEKEIDKKFRVHVWVFYKTNQTASIFGEMLYV